MFSKAVPLNSLGCAVYKSTAAAGLIIGTRLFACQKKEYLKLTEIKAIRFLFSLFESQDNFHYSERPPRIVDKKRETKTRINGEWKL